MEKIENALWKYHHSKFHVQTSESGLHSDLYLNTDLVISNPPLLRMIIKKIFLKKLKQENIKPNWVLTYPPFGIPLAYALAEELHAKMAYIDIQKQECTFDINPKDNILIVADDIYSGGSIKKTITIAKETGASIAPLLLSLGNFSGAKKLLGLEVISAITEKGNFYKKEECPMCTKGSKAILPRQNWKKLIENKKM